MEVRFGGRVLPPVTISLGLAAFPDHGAEPDDLLRAADAALYESKEGGRDRLTVVATRAEDAPAASIHQLAQGRG
jgi:GGDEF domain-containing protein